ncbi:MAG TPA: pyridoxal-phosphate dependent enzyme [Planctomycetota bacterium]|nr:pyridoxal-phosphate dependent enzyme [Planctomycetota bacterium]
MQPLVERFPGLLRFPHVDLGVRATPVEPLRAGGIDLLVKRDDLCGGNKPRSLEFLLAGRPARVLTVSTLSAHHAYATAFHARALGGSCDAIIVRRGRPSPFLALLPDLAHSVVETGGAPGAVAAALSLWRPGVLWIPPGGMSARGALGYLVAALELENVPPRIYVPLGTGTTVSGLLAGLMLRGAVTEVVAVRVADRIAGWKPLLWRRAFAAVALLRRFDPSVPRTPGPGGVRLRVVKARGRYGEPTREALAAVAAAPGLPLEATYTGKTLAVLLSERAEGALYVHTHAALPS